MVAVSWIALNKNFVGRFVDYLALKFQQALNLAIEQLIAPVLLEELRLGYFHKLDEQLTGIVDILYTTQEIVGEALLDRFGDDCDTLWTRYIEDATECYARGVDFASCAYYSYLDAIGINYPMLAWWLTAKHCGFWWAFKDVAVITPKPSAIYLNTEGRLCAKGMPAVVYCGFRIYSDGGINHWEIDPEGFDLQS